MNRYLILSTAFFALVSICRAEYWFDSKIKEYLDWPLDGSDKIVVGEGTWANTEYATLDAEKHELNVFTPIDYRLDFNASIVKQIGYGGQVVFKASLAFPYGNLLPEVEEDAKGSITVFKEDENSSARYYCLVMDNETGKNVWLPFEGAEPLPENQSVEVQISAKKDGGDFLVRYMVDGVDLTLNGNVWNKVYVKDHNLQGASLSGQGMITALSATTDVLAPNVDFSIPAVDNVTVASVMIAGVEIFPVGGVYKVPAGSVVNVTFKPAPGYALLGGSGGKGTYIVFENTVITENEIPAAVNVQGTVMINEIMAKNDTVKYTLNGGQGLDWVEIKNTGDVDLDLTGWYLFDDPEKAQSKWKKIKGSCIVPANGTKIVWADKSYTNFAENEAYTEVGLSTDGETLFLADPNGKILHSVSFPMQMKDVSYGLGRREKTILSKNAPAAYKVGDGAWKNVSGVLGMPGSVSDFKVTSYKLSSSQKNIDQVISAIETGNYSNKTVTENVKSIAFQDGGSRTEFAPYASFADLGVSGDNYAVVVEGTIKIPEPGVWTFCVGSDDGFALELSNPKYTFKSEYSAGRSYTHSMTAFHFPEADSYNVKLVYFELTGAATFDFSVAKGDQTVEGSEFSNQIFKLVGSDGCVVAHAGNWEGYIDEDVSPAMKGVNDSLDWKSKFNLESAPAEGDVIKLKVCYADGFTASVNGTQVASQTSSVQRDLKDAVIPQIVEVPSSLLVKGENTLEITALNNDIEDNRFLLSCEMTIMAQALEFVYFKEPTPGAENDTFGWGAMTPKVTFSEPHGYKSESFMLELSCPEAPNSAIYYTLDGSSPTTSSFLYSGPVSISKTTCIRAGVPQEGAILQLDSSATYLYIEDILKQSQDVPANFPADKAINSHAMRYGMNKTYVEANKDVLYAGFTNKISTISLVVDPKNLFDPVTGIYVNPSLDGRPAERMTMIEQIDPKNPSNCFAVPGGVRIRGGASRGVDHAKHSLRLFFRSEYGMGSLEHPLFDTEGASSFAKVDLRTSQNYSWSNENSDKDTFIHECFSRDAQGAMGQYYTRSRYYNLFINGQYWGLYQTQERGDEDFAETYNGGDKDNYDVIKTSSTGSSKYVTGANEGTDEAWRALWEIAVGEGFEGDKAHNYNRLMGLNPDGTRNPSYPVYLNPENLAVYMLITHFVCDSDSPYSVWGNHVNNMYAVRNRIDGDGKLDGFYFLKHDAEHSMGAKTDYSSYSHDPTKYGAEKSDYERFGPAALHWQLGKHPEYRVLLADLFYRHFIRPGGAMTAEKAKAMFKKRMSEIDEAIALECARWSTNTEKRNPAAWIKACNNCLDFIDKRLSYMISQYRNRNWYPSIDTPYIVDENGGRLADGTVFENGGVVTASLQEGTEIYYTFNGTDPRVVGGNVSASASKYENGIELPSGNVVIKMRAKTSAGEWSALEEIALSSGTPVISEQGLGIRIAEVMSSTVDDGGDGSEFIVLTNMLDKAVSLEGFNIKAAKEGAEIKFDITLGSDIEIMPLGTLLLKKADYWPSGKITNGKVNMWTYDSAGKQIQKLYFSANWWNKVCDGKGAHFIALDFSENVSLENQWKPSFEIPVTSEGIVNESAAAAISNAVASDDRIRVWLNALASSDGEGKRAIAAFNGTASTLAQCFLVSILPETEPEIELVIPKIAIDPVTGKITIDGRLNVHGKEKTGSINGSVKLYHGTTLEALNNATEGIPLGGTFPIVEREAAVNDAKSGFYKLKIE